MTKLRSPLLVITLLVLVSMLNIGCGKEKTKKKPVLTHENTTFYFVDKWNRVYLSIPEEQYSMDFEASRSGLYKWVLRVDEKLRLWSGSLQLVLSSDGPKIINADVGFYRNYERLYAADVEFLIDSTTPQAVKRGLLVMGFDLEPGDEIRIQLNYERGEASAKLFNFSGTDATFIRLESEKREE